MESINPSFSPLVKVNREAQSAAFQPISAGAGKQKFVNDVAASMPALLTNGATFDAITNNIANFKDMLSVAQNGVFQMREQGECIRNLIAQAREEGVTPELLDKIQAEVDSRLGEIRKIREGVEFNGVHPLMENFKLDVPNVLELMGAQNKAEASGEISNMLASFDIDISVEGDGFSFGGSAKIEIGYTDDGALQINVDASMDFDLSGLLNNGVSSDEAWDMINQFLDMLGVQEGDLGNAQNFMDALFEMLFDKMAGRQYLPDGVEVEMDSSNSLKGHMVQQASITLDGMAGQAPSIAINIL